jgi:hypothetical protein
MNRAMAICCLSVWAAACTPDTGDPEDFVPGDIDDPGEPLDTDQPQDTGDPGDTGDADPEPQRFALLEVVSTQMDDPNPFSSDTGITQLYAWKQVDLVRDGVDIRWTETVCAMESTEVFGTLTVYPDALVHSMPAAERSATLSDTVTGATFTMASHVTLLGADLVDPATDPMPDEASDPEQWDQDGDGNPGVTVVVEQSLLGEGEVYVAQRTFTAYDGVLISAERMEGYVDSDNEQVILDASAWWLELDTNSQDDPEPSHSYFVLQQVDAGTDCDGILAQRDTLFD